MKKSFLQRRHEAPKYDLQANITGVGLPGGKVHWNVKIYGETNNEIAANILERVAKVLRSPDEKE